MPSTAKQKQLGQLLAEELAELGLSDAEMDEWGCVTATLPASEGVSAPTIGLIAHMDTSPEVSGTDVKPMVHSGYEGGPIQLNAGIEITPVDCVFGKNIIFAPNYRICSQ